MILIGQYDSPFTRRVAIALKLYGLAFEHRPWSTFGDADKIAPYQSAAAGADAGASTDGEALIESTAILDYLDELVGPDEGDDRGAAGRSAATPLKICALATGLGDKAVSLIYERVLRKDAAETLGRALRGADRRRAGDAGGASAPRSHTPYWFGERIGHADIAVACVLRFTAEAHPHAVRRRALRFYGALGVTDR